MGKVKGASATCGLRCSRPRGTVSRFWGVFAWPGGPWLPSETWKAGPASWAGARAGSHRGSGARRLRQRPRFPRIHPGGVVAPNTDGTRSCLPASDLSAGSTPRPADITSSVFLKFLCYLWFLGSRGEPQVRCGKRHPPAQLWSRLQRHLFSHLYCRLTVS